MDSTLMSPVTLPEYLQPEFAPRQVQPLTISPTAGAPAGAPPISTQAATGAALATGEPTPATPSMGKVEQSKFMPIATGGSMTSTGASIGAMTGNPLAAVAGAGVGYAIDSLMLAKEKEEKRRAMEKQMRLEMQRQRYEEGKRATASRLNAIGPRVQYLNGQRADSKAGKVERLNSMYQSIQGRIQGGFTR